MTPVRSIALISLVLGASVGCSGQGDTKRHEALDGAVLGEPIDVASTEEWVWVPIEGTMCADGTQGGVGVNFTTRSRELVIWFQGNGVCYDLTSCTLFQNLLTGMGPDPLNHMWWGDPNTGHTGTFDRTDPQNPLRNSNFIVFPHCTVDGHTADKTSTYPPLAPVEQHGYRNVTITIPRIVGTFRDATRVVVAGFSAGGIGAKANYHKIATAFEAVGQPPPFLIDDSGPFLRAPFATPQLATRLREGWGLDQTVDPYCPKCVTDGYSAAYETLATLHPGLRTAVISAYQDAVASALYALLNNPDPFDGAAFEAGLRDLSAYTSGNQSAVAPSTQRQFYYPGARHGALVVAALSATPGLTEFLDAQLSGSSSWTTVEP